MKLKNFPTGALDWSQVAETTHAGTSGVASSRLYQLGEIQLRRIVYSTHYVSDHWCLKGHIVILLEGEATIEHQDGTNYILSAGTAYHVADDQNPPHRLITEAGATVFVMD